MIYPPPNHSIITVVHRRDLALFYLHAQSLRQNWQGQRRWHIVIEDDPELKPWIEDLVKSWSDWIITIDYPQFPPELDILASDDPNAGWWRQQSLKLWAADHYTSDCYLILDCKNILLKPADLTLWYHAGSWAICLKEGQDTDWLWHNTLDRLGIDPLPPRSSDLTPWVWPQNCVRATMARLTDLGIGWRPRQLRSAAISEFPAVWAYSVSQGLWPWHEFHSTTEFAYRPQDSSRSEEHYIQCQEKFNCCPWSVFWTQHRRYLAKDLKQQQLLKTQIDHWALNYDPQILRELIQDLDRAV